jgi:putative membrane protein insertion efficiency factor
VTAVQRAGTGVRRVAVLPIRGYQMLISPLLGAHCKYYPSCSEYAVQAVRRFGILRGLVLAGWRLLRCNPLSRGGFDPVEAQRLFAARPSVPSA